MTTQYPFHPLTGQRLVRTIETAVIFSAATISKVDENEVVEVIKPLGINAGDIEKAQIDNTPFVATAGGDSCLLSEAVWSVLDVESLEGFTSTSSGTPLPSLNSTLEDLVALGEATQTVLDNWARGHLANAVHELEDAVLAIPLLSQHLQNGADD